jgi:hypothetical protein
MKTDVVLTIDEYLDQCCALAKPVSPPTHDARHVPITTGGDVDLHPKERGCRCDRWGHPCLDCIENGKAR